MVRWELIGLELIPVGNVSILPTPVVCKLIYHKDNKNGIFHLHSLITPTRIIFCTSWLLSDKYFTFILFYFCVSVLHSYCLIVYLFQSLYLIDLSIYFECYSILKALGGSSLIFTSWSYLIDVYTNYQILFTA